MDNEGRRVEVASSRFKRVCVFCGSSTGKREAYREAAVELGQELVYICVFLFFRFYVVLFFPPFY